MDGRWRKAVLAWAVGLAVLGGAGPALAAEPKALDGKLRLEEFAWRAGVTGLTSPGPHLRLEGRVADIQLDFDYGAVPESYFISWLGERVNSSGRLLRLGLAVAPADWIAFGIRGALWPKQYQLESQGASWSNVDFDAGLAPWIVAGPPGIQWYAGFNDGGLVSLPLNGPRLGVLRTTQWGELAARLEVAAGYTESLHRRGLILQLATVLAHPMKNSPWWGEFAMGIVASGEDLHAQFAFGTRWKAPSPPAQPAHPADTPLASETAYVPAAPDTWLGRETTWLHRPSGLPQTCTVTEAAAMEDMTWLYQTCTPGPADAIMPWATGCYVLDHLGLWRLPTCPGEAPGKLTRPLLLVPSRGAADPRFVDLNDATWQRRVLKLEGRNVQVECQRVPGLQTYEACMSPQEGLLFASVRATLAADRKRWPARSTELVQWRTVEVAPGSSHFGDEVSQCHWSSACRVLGECRDQGGRCVAQRDDDCAPAAVCAIRGACGAVAGRCAPKTAAMCESSENCRRLGQCQLGKVIGAPACVAADDLACQAAEVCAAQGLCRAERGRCVAGGVVPGAELPAEVTPVTAPR